MLANQTYYWHMLIYWNVFLYAVFFTSSFGTKSNLVSNDCSCARIRYFLHATKIYRLLRYKSPMCACMQLVARDKQSLVFCDENCSSAVAFKRTVMCICVIIPLFNVQYTCTLPQLFTEMFTQTYRDARIITRVHTMDSPLFDPIRAISNSSSIVIAENMKTKNQWSFGLVWFNPL